MYFTRLGIPFFGLLGLMLTACGGSGEGLDGNGQPVEGDTGGQELTATLESIQSNIFTPTCGVSGCHSAGSASAGLVLETLEDSIANLINVQSQQVTTLNRVTPTDPDNSYLIQKLEGMGILSQMPLNQTPLSTETISLIREWISNGALVANAPSIQAQLFNTECVSCHSGEVPAGELNLEEGHSFSNLVGVSRFPEEPDYPVRVVPGNSDTSFMIMKLEGHLVDGEGVAMPLNAEPISTENIDIVRQWIDDGAKY